MSGAVVGQVRRPPSLRARVASSAATIAATLGLALGLTFVLLVVLGGIALLAMLLTGHGFDGISFGNPSTPDAPVPDNLPTRPPWPTWLAPAVIAPAIVLGVVGAVVGSARLGHGSVGDAIVGIDTLNADDTAPARTLHVLRAALPWLLGGMAGALATPRLGLIVLVLLWLPALLGPRRTAVDIALGLHPTVVIRPKLGRAWGDQPLSPHVTGGVVASGAGKRQHHQLRAGGERGSTA